MPYKPSKHDHRTAEQLRMHYEIEKELADKLRRASKQERRHLYSSLYDELYQRVPFHPRLTRKASPLETLQHVNLQMKLLRRFLNNNITFLEIGPGDCALAIEMAKYVKQVYAVDVSDEITKGLTCPPNFQLILSDGVSVPVPPGSINLAYSNQLMEHLHPEDAFEQLENNYKALAPGGVYICITPNRLNGPHDISKYFDEVATGFHLKEYTTSELISLFSKVGFSRVLVCLAVKGKYMSFPAFPIVLYESLLSKLPQSLRKSIARTFPFRLLLGIRLIGIK